MWLQATAPAVLAVIRHAVTEFDERNLASFFVDLRQAAVFRRNTLRSSQARWAPVVRCLTPVDVGGTLLDGDKGVVGMFDDFLKLSTGQNERCTACRAQPLLCLHVLNRPLLQLLSRIRVRCRRPAAWPWRKPFRYVTQWRCWVWLVVTDQLHAL